MPSKKRGVKKNNLKTLYYVTQDLEELIDNWCASNQLETPPSLLFDKLRKRLKSNLEAALGSGAGVEYVQPAKFRFLREWDAQSEFLISLDDVYFKQADAHIRLTRLWDEPFDKKALGVGRRPYTDSLAMQYAKCVAAHEKGSGSKGDRKVILADDGTFTGGTLTTVIGELLARGIRVKEVRVVLCTVESIAEMNEFAYKNGLKVTYSPGIVIDRDRDLIDWVCERDFYPGVPRSGRTHGRRKLERVEPLENPAVGYPYTFPLGPVQEGATILGKALRFSAEQLNASIELWNNIIETNVERLRGANRITLRRLSCADATLEGGPRMLGNFPGPPDWWPGAADLEITDYLTRTLNPFPTDVS